MIFEIVTKSLIVVGFGILMYRMWNWALFEETDD